MSSANRIYIVTHKETQAQRLVRNVYLSPVVYSSDVEGATLEIGEHRFMPCDVRKFMIEPCNGGVIDLTCSASFFPSADEVAGLARMVQSEERVTIAGPADLFASAQ